MSLDLGFTSVIESLVKHVVWYTTLGTARRDMAGASVRRNSKYQDQYQHRYQMPNIQGHRAGHPSSCVASNSVSLTMNLLHVGGISLVVVVF
jgi:hypothetical protein